MLMGAASPAPAQATASDSAAVESTRMLEKSDARRAFIEQLNNPNRKMNVGLSYWIELTRNGKSYRCNNKYKFRSGDLIKFHMVANADGYVYVVLKKGSSGTQSLLFPSAATGMDNELKLARDYSVPTKTALQFDNKPGIEEVALIFSRTKLEPAQYFDDKLLTCYVSSHQDGAKDLVPTRMQLSWDDPDPVILPEQMLASGAPQVVTFTGDSSVKVGIDASRTELKAKLKDKSYVYVVSENPDNPLAMEVVLQHE
jgi:hypothetical protein